MLRRVPDMQATGLRSGLTWAAYVSAPIFCLACVYLINALLGRFSINYDLPPTRYAAITLLLIVSDLVAAIYVTFGALRLSSQQVAPGRLLKAIVALSVVLGVAHAGTVFAYSKIPQW